MFRFRFSTIKCQVEHKVCASLFLRRFSNIFIRCSSKQSTSELSDNH